MLRETSMLHSVNIIVDESGRVRFRDKVPPISGESCRAILTVVAAAPPGSAQQVRSTLATVGADGTVKPDDAILVACASEGYLTLLGAGELTPEQERQVSDRFKFLWKQYLNVVNLTITLITGTLLLFLNLAFNERTASRMDHLGTPFLYCGYGSVFLFLLALVSAVIWRMLSQIYMEKEVFGKAEIVEQYLKDAGIDDYKYTFQEKTNRHHRRVWIFTRIATYVLLGFGWLLCVVFFLGFIGAAPQQ